MEFFFYGIFLFAKGLGKKEWDNEKKKKRKRNLFEFFNQLEIGWDLGELLAPLHYLY